MTGKHELWSPPQWRSLPPESSAGWLVGQPIRRGIDHCASRPTSFRGKRFRLSGARWWCGHFRGVIDVIQVHLNTEHRSVSVLGDGPSRVGDHPSHRVVFGEHIGDEVTQTGAVRDAAEFLQ